jgi:ubiquinone/menaquinone biosynthesis C-methylase UbiE
VFKNKILYTVQQKFNFVTKYLLASSGYKLLPNNNTTYEIGVEKYWSRKMIYRQHKSWIKILKSTQLMQRADTRAFLKLIDLTTDQIYNICEIGCGSAYNYNLIKIKLENFNYSGLDSSHEALRKALTTQDSLNVVQGISSHIPLLDNSFDLVIDGATLIHVTDWKNSLSEYYRISKKYLMLHSLTLTNSPTTIFTKYAYGSKLIELAFNYEELQDELARVGFVIISKQPGEDYDLLMQLGIETKSESWLLEKAPKH